MKTTIILFVLAGIFIMTLELFVMTESVFYSAATGVSFGMLVGVIANEIRELKELVKCLENILLDSDII